MHQEKESLEVMVARIDERVAHIHKDLKAVPILAKIVNRHDREILIAKVLVGIAILILGIKFPAVADAVARFTQ